MTRTQRGLSLAVPRMGHSPNPVTPACGAGGPRQDPEMLLLLLGLVLGGRGAAAFVVQLWGSCSLAPNGSVPSFTLGFNGIPLVCSEPGAPGSTVPCTQGVLETVAEVLAQDLSMNPAWRQRMREREHACSRLQPHRINGLGSAPPQVRITSSSSGDPSVPVLLTCHVWGFYPPDITVLWLHNGLLVPPGDNPPPIVPNGDLTYQTHSTLLAAPTHGDTFTCSVQHPTLDQPILMDWDHGLPPMLVVKVVAATVVMLLGIGLFAIGLHRYRAPPPGYTFIDGDTHPKGSI